jgi:hypothetical protein
MMGTDNRISVLRIDLLLLQELVQQEVLAAVEVH